MSSFFITFHENMTQIYCKNIVKRIVFLGREENSTKVTVNKAKKCTIKRKTVKLFKEKSRMPFT